MTALVRWKPVRRLSPWQRAAARSNWLAPHWDSRVSMPVDIEEKEDVFVIKASVPGFSSDEIDVSIENDRLTIRGERQEETEESREGYYLSERYQGSIERSFCLGERVNRDEINAELENGVLTLTLSKVEQAKPVKVAVKSA